MGKSSSVTTGYRYYLTWHLGLTHGPVDEIAEIRGDDRTMYPRQQTTAVVRAGGEIQAPRPVLQPVIDRSGTYYISQPNLYGGDKNEGGVDGVMTVLMGEATQGPSPALAVIEPGARPAYRDICSVVFDGELTAVNPYIKPWQFRVRRWVKGWKTPVWRPELAKVGKGMNAAHIVWQCMTDTMWGVGEDATTGLDEPSFATAAQALMDEELGLCLKWSLSDGMSSFIQLVLDHVAAVRFVDPATNKLGIRLLRGDYDAQAMASDPSAIIDENDIMEMSSYQVPVINETVNQITVTYRDVETNRDAAVTYQNLANIQAQGKVVSEAVSYRGVYRYEDGARLAARDCNTKSALLIKGKTKIKSRRWPDLKVGDVKLLNWAREKCYLMPVRILEVDQGDATARTISISWAQDEFAVPSTTYIAAAPTQWLPAETAPLPVPQQRLFELPYRDISRLLDAGSLQALAADSAYVAGMATRPVNCLAFNFGLFSHIGTGTYMDHGSGDFAPSAVLLAGVDLAAVVLQIDNAAQLTTVQPGTAALLGDEIVRVDAIDPITGQITVGRGCADTVPAPHAVGVRVWFYEDDLALDRTQYMAGDTVQAKFITRASEGLLNPDLAPAESLTMVQRQSLPYPPGKVTIAAAPYPTAVTGPFTVTWSGRNRLFQADQLIDTSMGGIGAARDVRYGLAFYDANGALLVERTDIGEDHADVTLKTSGPVTMKLYAISDVGESYQKHQRTFDYTAAGSATQNTITAQTYLPPP